MHSVTPVPVQKLHPLGQAEQVSPIKEYPGVHWKHSLAVAPQHDAQAEWHLVQAPTVPQYPSGQSQSRLVTVSSGPLRHMKFAGRTPPLCTKKEVDLSHPKSFIRWYLIHSRNNLKV